MWNIYEASYTADKCHSSNENILPQTHFLRKQLHPHCEAERYLYTISAVYSLLQMMVYSLQFCSMPFQSPVLHKYSGKLL